MSPQGDKVAFSVRQASVPTNDYVVRWFVVGTTGTREPEAVQIDGGQPIPMMQSGLPQAYIPAEPAKWSLDGRRFAFRRAIGEAVELWVVEASTLAARRVSVDGAQVDAFMWAKDGALLWRTGLEPDAFRRAVADEARTGWRLDDRMPLFAARNPEPTPPNCSRRRESPGCRVESFAADGGTEPRAATGQEIAALDAFVGAIPPVYGPRSKRWGVISSDSEIGPVVRTIAADDRYAESLTPIRRVATDARTCELEACTGQTIDAVGPARAGETVWFIKRERSDGPQIGAYDQTVVYEWRPSSHAVREVLRTDDKIEDCHARGRKLICARAAWTRPAHLVSLDLSTGQAVVLADPNPALKTKIFPRVRKATFEGVEGNPGFAHVVYPKDYRSGQAYPAVLVPYRSRGFLRGGTGDEVPIFPLAAQGFVVVAIDKPEFMREAAVMGRDDFEVFRYAGDFRDRRNTFEGDRNLVRALVDDGLVDQGRVAITGLSAGSEMVHYALQQSDDFAAAVASQGANDATLLAMVPSGWGRNLWKKMLGAQGLVPRPGDRLLDLAWSSKPERLRTPLLLNVGQNELMFGFEGVQALMDAGRPIEVRVFPDETHVKYHPASYAGIYDNNIRWLRFWLQGYVDPDPAYASVYERWGLMKEKLGSPAPPDPIPPAAPRSRH